MMINDSNGICRSCANHGHISHNLLIRFLSWMESYSFSRDVSFMFVFDSSLVHFSQPSIVCGWGRLFLLLHRHPSGVNQRFFLSSWNSSFAIESSVLPAILFRRSFGRTRPIRDHIFVMENYWGLLLLQRYWFMLTQYLLALQFHLQLRERKRGKNSQCKQWFTIENPSSGDSVANI